MVCGDDRHDRQRRRGTTTATSCTSPIAAAITTRTRRRPTAETGEYGFEDFVNAELDGPHGTPDGALQTGGERQRAEYSGQHDALRRTVRIRRTAAAQRSSRHDVAVALRRQHAALDAVHGDRRRQSRHGAVNRPVLFRRALKLVNGGIVSGVNNLPTAGLTVAAENPVYVQGNYNATTVEQRRTERAGGDHGRRGHAAVEQLERRDVVPVPELRDDPQCDDDRLPVCGRRGKGPVVPVAVVPGRRTSCSAPTAASATSCGCWRTGTSAACRSTTADRSSACSTAGRRPGRSSTGTERLRLRRQKLHVRLGLSAAVAAAAWNADVPRREHADVQADSPPDAVAAVLALREALGDRRFCDRRGLPGSDPPQIPENSRGAVVAPC